MRKWLAPVVILGLAIVLPACSSGGLSPFFPTPVSPNGQHIDFLYKAISVPAILVFLLVEGLLLTAVIKFRRSKQPPGYVPPQIHGDTRLEIIWTVIPTILVIAIAAASAYEMTQDFVKPTDAATDIDIHVVGHQFGWDYYYPDGFVVHENGTLQGSVTPVVVPTGKLVRLQIDSTDVIHSWWVPAVTGKTDAVPGYSNFTWMKIDTPGSYRGECAELCGSGHDTMQIIVLAVSQSDYDSWVASQKEAANATPAASPSASPSASASASPSASPSASSSASASPSTTP